MSYPNLNIGEVYEVIKIKSSFVQLKEIEDRIKNEDWYNELRFLIATDLIKELV